MNSNDYNYGQTIFYLCFLSAELPSQLISKKLGPDNWIPIQMVSWSLVASFQAFLSGRSSFFACRALLGLIEGGFILDNILYLSYFYTGWELPGRLGWFWVSYQSTNIISAFLAVGILRLRGHNGPPLRLQRAFVVACFEVFLALAFCSGRNVDGHHRSH